MNWSQLRNTKENKKKASLSASSSKIPHKIMKIVKEGEVNTNVAIIHVSKTKP